MTLCFVVGPIGAIGTPERKHSDLLLHTVLKPVLQDKEFGYTVKRADEDADPGLIGDRLIHDLVNADLVVADLTDLNPNAFYELGIRHAAMKPTIHIARLGTPLPFDNAGQRTIFVDLTDFHSLEDARSRLAKAARAIAEPKYRVTNPVNQALDGFKMRESTNPLERVLAEILERLGSIENSAGRQASLDAHKAALVNVDPDTRSLAWIRPIFIALRDGDYGAAASLYQAHTGIPIDQAIDFIKTIDKGDIGRVTSLLSHHTREESLKVVSIAEAFDNAAKRARREREKVIDTL